MKIIDVPQAGKYGLAVAYQGRTGQIRRAWVVPANPRSANQLVIRSQLGSQASAWRQLTAAQQDAWIAAAAGCQTKSSLGQSGTLTGLQLFTKINCSLLAIGEAPLTAPPAKPTLTQVPVDALEITNTAGVIALKLHTTDAPLEGTMFRASAPQSNGTRRPLALNLLGTLGTPSNGYIDVTTAYTGRYGVPAVGDLVFVQVNANMNGWQGPRTIYSSRVPASA
jgi:hypothetical protein